MDTTPPGSMLMAACVLIFKMKIFLNWSGGKDACFSLYRSKKEGKGVNALVTTLQKETERVSMHGLRRSLLEKQAASVQLPLYTVMVDDQPSLSAYEQGIHHMNRTLKAEGFTHVMSGDLFLEDLKAYRERLYEKDGLYCLFPLWKKDTRQLLLDFIGEGFKAIVVCVHGGLLDKSFCGRMIDEEFLNDLPPGVDPCGENGEYHSFVFDGPLFREPVQFERGDMVYREYASPKAAEDDTGNTAPATPFYFCDLRSPSGSYL